MKRLLLVPLIILVLNQNSEAQLWKLKRLELVGGAGASVFFGDVGGFSHGENAWGLKDITFLQTRYDFNFNVKYRITREIYGRVSLTAGLLKATDERGSNEGRNFEASTTIFETALIGEYYFIKNSAENSYLFNKRRAKGLIDIFRKLDFYAFTGIGGLSYSIEPNEKLQNHGLDDKGFAAVIPIGLGGTLAAYPNTNLGFEFGFRYSFSDNIDGYTSQYSTRNDVYYFFNLTVTYRLKLNKRVLSSFR